MRLARRYRAANPDAGGAAVIRTGHRDQFLRALAVELRQRPDRSFAQAVSDLQRRFLDRSNPCLLLCEADDVADVG